MKSILTLGLATLLSATLLAQDAKPPAASVEKPAESPKPSGERIIHKTFSLRAPQAKEVKARHEGGTWR